MQHLPSSPTLWNLSDGQLHKTHNGKYLRMGLAVLFVRIDVHQREWLYKWLNNKWNTVQEWKSEKSCACRLVASGITRFVMAVLEDSISYYTPVLD